MKLQLSNILGAYLLNEVSSSKEYHILDITSRQSSKASVIVFANEQGELTYNSKQLNFIKDNVPHHSIALLDITGIIMNSGIEGGENLLLNTLKEFDSNSNIHGIILIIDSPGGNAITTLEIAKVISEFNKPVMSLVKHAAGGAYLIAAATCEICAENHNTVIGSIGLPSVDSYSGELRFTQMRLAKQNQECIDLVCETRGEKLEADIPIWATSQKSFTANEALRLGLIDSIMDFSSLIRHITHNII